MVRHLAVIVVALEISVSGASAQAVTPKPAASQPTPSVRVGPPAETLEDLARQMAELASSQAHLAMTGLDLESFDSAKLRAELAQVQGTGLQQEVRREVERAYVAARADRQEASYEFGLQSLSQGRLDRAIESFDAVIKANGSHRDGALYWKAYALNRLGRRDDALVALDTLLKGAPNGRWVSDARALQLEVKQSSGQPPNPAQETDEELKLIALNGLMQRAPEQAFPMVEKILSGSASPRMKERALFVLAQSGSDRAKTLLTEMAKGKGNPDLQLKALDYLGSFSGGPNVPLLVEVYKGTSDTDVKRRVIRSLAATGRRGVAVYSGPGTGFAMTMPEVVAGVEFARVDAERIRAQAEVAVRKAELASAEAERGVREGRTGATTGTKGAVAGTGAGSGAEAGQGPGTGWSVVSAEREKAREARAKEAAEALWQLYQGEPAVELKREILQNMSFADQADRLLQVVRTEKSPELREAALQGLAWSRAPKMSDTLLTLYREEKDASVKRRIIDSLGSQGGAAALVQIARQETDLQLRKRVVERLSYMKDKEATDYLMEILKK